MESRYRGGHNCSLGKKPLYRRNVGLATWRPRAQVGKCLQGGRFDLNTTLRVHFFFFKRIFFLQTFNLPQA